MAKVLIGIPTYARGKDSLVPLLNAIDAFQCSTDLLFADNSENDDPQLTFPGVPPSNTK